MPNLTDEQINCMMARLDGLQAEQEVDGEVVYRRGDGECWRTLDVDYANDLNAAWRVFVKGATKACNDAPHGIELYVDMTGIQLDVTMLGITGDVPSKNFEDTIFLEPGIESGFAWALCLAALKASGKIKE